MTYSPRRTVVVHTLFEGDRAGFTNERNVFAVVDAAELCYAREPWRVDIFGAKRRNANARYTDRIGRSWQLTALPCLFQRDVFCLALVPCCGQLKKEVGSFAGGIVVHLHGLISCSFGSTSS